MDEPRAPGTRRFLREERLRRRAEFQCVYRDGEKRVGEAFLCYVMPGSGQGWKMGLAVSRKVGGAVVRNRVKRRIREIYRTYRTEIAFDEDGGPRREKGASVVIVARPASASLDYPESERALRALFRRRSGGWARALEIGVAQAAPLEGEGCVG